MTLKRSICVFCGARPGVDPKHVKLATLTGEAIANDGYRLVYGGGGLGLMGTVARSAHNAGGDVLGIMPEFLADIEKTLPDIENRLVDNMHDRKIAMFNESDGFIVLPGGIGTLEEAVEILSWMRLNLHEKPMVFLDDTEYWTPFMKSITHIVEEGFADEALLSDMHHAHTAEDALKIIDHEIRNPKKREPLNLLDSKV